MKINILYEDNHIIAVEKEAGVLTQQDSSGVPSLLDAVRDYIKQKYDKPGNVFCGLVHRLDRQVSGVIVFARTSKAARRLSAEFAGRSVVKMYVALVENRQPIEPDIWFDREDRLVRKRGYSEKADGKSRNIRTASLRFMAVASNESYSLLLVSLKTGRKHQIRAQLAAMGTPVVGDATYGHAGPADDAGGICLHAVYLRINHPTKKEPVEFFSRIPTRISERLHVDDAITQKISDAIKAYR
ncbi:MAG: RluA family pseudouridine synthase [Spirochaetes bacterium]|nr:RluA family pseudouridine synthase [Spirochaetota bacterium]